MENNQPDGEPPLEKPDAESSEIDVHYDQAPSYQTFHADGVHGGISPNGDHLVLDLYVERIPNPKLIRHAIQDDGSLGEEVARGGREGVLRERQCGVVMNWGAALRLHSWLTDQLKTAEEAGIIQIEDDSTDAA